MSRNKKYIEGLPVFRPRLLLPWILSRNNIIELFAFNNIEMITEDYYVVSTCVFQEDFCCNIGFHLKDNEVYKLEFFRSAEYYNSSTIEDSYLAFQAILVDFFGIPNKKSKYKSIWKFDHLEVAHYIIERFYLEEHVEIYIERKGGSGMRTIS